MPTFVRLVVSALLAVLLLWPLGGIYGAAGLPVYHSWGLVHGAFATAAPALGAACYSLLGLVPWFGAREDLLPRLLASLSVIPLVTVLFYLNQRSQHALSIWHVAAYAVLFALFVALCVRSSRPVLIPLFILVPLLVEPVFGLLLTVSYSPASALQLFVHELASSLLPATLATGAALIGAMAAHKHDA